MACFPNEPYGPQTDNTMRHDDIPEDELDDFRQTLEEYGYQEQDSCLEAKINPATTAGIHPVTGQATVKNIKTGVERTYRTGHRTAWVVEFAADLEKNVFAG